MKFIKKNIKKIIGILAVILILTVAFWYGGNAPGSRGFSGFGKQNTESENSTELTKATTGSEPDAPTDIIATEVPVTEQPTTGQATTEQPATEQEATGQEATGQATTEQPATEQATTEPATTEQPAAERPTTEQATTEQATTEQPTTEKPTTERPTTEQATTERSTTEQPTTEQPTTEQATTEQPTTETPSTEEQKAEQTYTCTISINCDNILKNWDMLDRSKQSCVPADGWILKEVEVEFKKGQTVFDVLKDITKKKSIQLEYSFTALYGSYYIEGIHNLYEFDCGELSGWEYCVNGKFPAFGCSKYVLKDGDKIEWKYTCDLGADVGNPYFE